MASSARPLEAVTVLDLTQLVAGPMATMLLADAGANVIKIERPQGGDPFRQLGPFRSDELGRTVGAQFLRFGRNKRSLALDLSVPAGREVFCSLVRRADVVCENFVPGTMERLGLDYPRLREINPRIIYAAISGFGQDARSPYLRRPALDIIAQALSGIMDMTGQPDAPPSSVGASIGDIIPGLFCTIGILLALQSRQMTGVGQLVDVAMYDSLATVCERPAFDYILTGLCPSRASGMATAPYGAFRAKDGYIAIATATEGQWRALCAAIDRADLILDPSLATSAGRVEHRDDVLRPALEGWLAQRAKAEAAAYLAEKGVPAAPVQTVAEMVECAHIASRQMLLEMQHPVAGAVRVMGNPIKLSALAEPEVRPAPLLGEQTNDILRELLGCDDAQIRDLAAAGAFGSPRQ